MGQMQSPVPKSTKLWGKSGTSYCFHLGTRSTWFSELALKLQLYCLFISLPEQTRGSPHWTQAHPLLSRDFTQSPPLEIFKRTGQGLEQPDMTWKLSLLWAWGWTRDLQRSLSNSIILRFCHLPLHLHEILLQHHQAVPHCLSHMSGSKTNQFSMALATLAGCQSKAHTLSVCRCLSTHQNKLCIAKETVPALARIPGWRLQNIFSSAGRSLQPQKEQVWNTNHWAPAAQHPWVAAVKGRMTGT